MGKRCICEICTCGRHRCPHRPNAPIGRGDQPCLLSEYATTYRQHPIEMRGNFKPKEDMNRSGEPLQDKTTHRVDFVPHPVAKPALHQPDIYKRPDGEHDMLTSYTKDYPEKQGEPAKVVKHEGMRQVPTKFEGEPTYKTDYRKWDMAGRPQRFGDHPAWHPPTQGFEGETTFQRDYKGHHQAPRQSMKPMEAAKMSDAPFDDKTGYREHYIKHPLPDRYTKEKDKYKPPAAPFDGLSTFKRDYQGAFAPKVDSCKPDHKAYQSGQPLEDMTTFKNDYRRWAVERPYQHHPDAYKRPEGEMDMNTTHNLNFKEYPLQRHEIRKPANAGVIRPGTFDGVTNYNTDFRPWDLSGRPKPMMRPDYNPNTQPFEGMPTYKAHYIQHNISPMRSFKPDASAFQSNAQFEDGTMYRTDYTPKKIDPCPAAILDTGTSRFKFVEVDTRGHKQYRPMYETVTELPKHTRQSPQIAPLQVA